LTLAFSWEAKEPVRATDPPRKKRLAAGRHGLLLHSHRIRRSEPITSDHEKENAP
jgi:hypothetical protein